MVLEAIGPELLQSLPLEDKSSGADCLIAELVQAWKRETAKAERPGRTE